MFCPRCGADYRRGFTDCAECRIPLVEGPGAVEPTEQPPLQLVTVLATGKADRIALAKSILMAVGIDFAVCGESVQDLFAWGRFPGIANPVTGPIELKVRASDAAEASALLEGPASIHEEHELVEVAELPVAGGIRNPMLGRGEDVAKTAALLYVGSHVFRITLAWLQFAFNRG